MDTYKLVRNIKIEEGYDVLVAGAGPAGCAAAIAAARLGAKVLLVEAMGCLGGLSTAGIVSEFDPMSNGERNSDNRFQYKVRYIAQDRLLCCLLSHYNVSYENLN